MVTIPTELLERQIRRLHRIEPDVPFDDLGEPLRSYVEYAMGTVQRGRWALDDLRRFGLRPGFRFLDAGCAYGGYLAAAAELGASEVVGIDVNEKYLDIARELLASCGVAARIEKGSLSDAALVESLGRFDVIACADVIEHVDDDAASLANLARALEPGGMLYLATPNPRCPLWVRSDPHFQLFGITLLQPPRARAYARAVTGVDYYDVGDFSSLARYRQLLGAQGLEVRLINMPTIQAEAVEKLRTGVVELEAEARAWSDARLPADLQDEVRGKVLALTVELRERLERGSRRSRWWHFRRRGEDALAEVVEEYAVQTWNLIARRPARG